MRFRSTLPENTGRTGGVRQEEPLKKGRSRMLPGFGFGGAPVVAAMNRALARITPKSVQRGWRDAIRRVLTILPRVRACFTLTPGSSPGQALALSRSKGRGISRPPVDSRSPFSRGQASRE
jgi:hypothetical protein